MHTHTYTPEVQLRWNGTYAGEMVEISRMMRVIVFHT